MNEADSNGIFIGPSYRATDGVDIVPIRPEMIDSARTWLTVALDAAVAHAELGRIDAQSLLAGAESGEIMIMFAIRRADLEVLGVAAAELFTSAAGRKVAHLSALSGVELDTWLEPGLAIFELLAKEQGAQSITLLGRIAWRDRLQPFGYKRLAIMLGKNLEDVGS